MPRPIRHLATRLVAATCLAASAFVPAVSLWVSPVEAAADGYRPLPAPERLLDTRAGQPTVDGAFSGQGRRPADSTLRLDVAGRAGLGAEPGSVMLNLTVDQAAAPGFITVWPCDQDRPNASNLNHVADQTVAVAAISRVAPDGTVCVYSLADTHVIIDAAGAYPADSFAALAAPERLVDTRVGAETIDGAFAGDGRRSAGDTYRVRVAGRGTVPPDATAAALNVTATEVTDFGFLTVFPCDVGRPNASNVNYTPGLTTPNLAVTRLDDNGDVCIYTLEPVEIVVDIAGTLTPEVFTALPEPRRLLDTRAGTLTFDSAFAGGGVQQNLSALQLDVAGRSGIPEGVGAVVLNVTSTGSTAPGFVAVHPQGSELPDSSNLNFPAGRTVANLVVAAVGPAGDVCLSNLSETHLVVDVAGWLAGPAPSGSTAACPARPSPAGAETYRNELIRRPALHRAVGTDRVAVYICRIPPESTGFFGDERHDRTDADFAAFANAEVAPYFAAASGGAYAIEFVANGMFDAAPTDGPGQCLDRAIALTGAGFTSAFVADSTFSGAGFASPGSIFRPDPEFGVFDRSVTDARRGGWVGGSAISRFPDAGTIVHEVGHTLHWPHSFVGPGTEYDNPVDVMSDGFGTCETQFALYRCSPGSTLAFNRLAAGWLRDGQVVAHPTGTSNYVVGSDDTHLVVAPDPAQSLSTLTLEARVAEGVDDFVEVEGVALHVVDQVDRFGGLSGLSTGRFARQAIGAGNSYDHVLRVGDTATVHGLTVTVLGRTGTSFEVRVAGNYTAPGNSFFVELPAGPR